MPYKASILFYELGNFTRHQLEKLSTDLETNPYSEEKGFGFQNVDRHVNYLSASLLKRTPTLISEYNAETNEIVKNKIFVYSNIKFSIDTDFNLLEIYGFQKDSSKVRSSLLNFFDHDVTIKQIDLTPFKVIPLLNKFCNSVKVSKLTINNFNFNNKAYGLFNINKLDIDYIDEFFLKYQNDIKKITAILDYEHLKQVELSINESGQISIKANDLEDALFTIKSIIIKN